MAVMTLDLIDGGALLIEGIDETDVSMAPRSHGVWRFGHREKLIVGCPLEVGRHIPDEGTSFFGGFRFQGGDLSLGTDVMLGRHGEPEAERRWAVWEGAQYSFVTELVGALGDAGALTDLMRRSWDRSRLSKLMQV
jgi:hypothetical protein